MSVCIGIENSKYFSYKDNNYNITLVINEVLTKNNGGLQDNDGDYNDWIEIYNYGDTDINLEGIGLSDDLDEPFKWVFPNVTIEAKSFLVVQASGKEKVDEDSIHTNFSLDKNGENIVLTDEYGKEIDSIKVPTLKENISMGRKPDGSDNYYILSKSTPEESNKVNVLSTIIPEKRLETPKFSNEGGFYEEEFELEIWTEDEDIIIYYTLDGSEPNTNSQIYKKPIKIESREGEENKLFTVQTVDELPTFTLQIGTNETYKGTVVRARAYKNGVFSDEIVTNSYFINPNYTLPIISLVTDEDNLFGYENGIYVPGKIYDEWRKENINVQRDRSPVPTNYNQQGSEWERESHIEFFEANGERGISQNVGVRISGNWSRMNACKSLRLTARKQYDSESLIKYKLFEDNDISTFKSITLRNSGNDFNRTMFKDVLIQSLVEDIGIDTQAYRPSILFINGEYWGIHNIRERYDEQYFKNNYNVDKSNLVILQRNARKDGMELSIGNEEDLNYYNNLMEFIESNDMSKNDNYRYVEERIDVDNFIKYTVSQIYFANQDWPQNNMKIWRSNESYDINEMNYSKWRWLMFDMDLSFSSYDNNTLIYALESRYDWVWNSGERSDLEEYNELNGNRCIPLKKLLENSEFRKKFLDTFELYMNTIFSPKVVINKIYEMARVIAPEIEEHMKRWSYHDTMLGKVWHNITGEKLNTDYYAKWQEEVDKLKEFAVKRPEYMKKYLDEYFEQYEDNE